MKTIKKQIQLKIAFMALVLMSSLAFAQNNSIIEETSKREGFIFEFSLGGGVIGVENSEGIQTFNKAQGAISFPELKFGYMLNDNLAL